MDTLISIKLNLKKFTSIWGEEKMIWGKHEKKKYLEGILRRQVLGKVLKS